MAEARENHEDTEEGSLATIVARMGATVILSVTVAVGGGHDLGLSINCRSEGVPCLLLSSLQFHRHVTGHCLRAGTCWLAKSLSVSSYWITEKVTYLSKARENLAGAITAPFVTIVAARSSKERFSIVCSELRTRDRKRL